MESLATLARKNIYLGTSSWKYPGWKGLVYQGDYASEKEFNEKCLEEYAAHFPCVGVDHTYYHWPLPSTFNKYATQTPEHFRMGLKVTEELTVKKYPNLKRYGKRAGQWNEGFLNPNLFKDKFLAPLEKVRDRLGPLMFEFSQFFPPMIASGREFVERLDGFFSELPGDYQYAVEMRNSGWLQPAYFEMLKKHRVAHVFNSWTRMPPLPEQLQAAANYPQPCYVARVLLQPGVKYEKAVEAFSPYNRVQMELTDLRQATASLIERAMNEHAPAYIFVNNRAEGCAPRTIEGILSYLG